MSTVPASPLLKIHRIDKSYGGTQVLKSCSLEVAPKETIVIVGPSGSGKSTLLRCVNLLESVDAGNILFEGRDLTRELKRVHQVRQQIGMVFQNFELFSHLSAIENIMLAPMSVAGVSRLDAHDLALALLNKVHLRERADHYPDQLSGGQQQRVAIARALAMKPKVMLYDEPTSALDPEMVNEVTEVMAELSAEGMTSLVVTHEMGFARRAADRIVFMEAGEVILTESSEQFFSGTTHERARRFLDQILH
ncbi:MULTISPECIES: amino acid ABC transporter ATP-binding protein [Paraburkholderia]|jgi:polar amino acid transport system ATP-binding protein|uniref:Amino acid ABC transporter ATP-binding protein (PAAT family) n=1 Tax=Paraburkholderia tropica TaxID=92647 RepID=A0A1A5XFP4_9BURK|nr:MULTISPECIES: amino acid ABC transporter ATP-binding protein [Paraburkholderia]MBB2982489.1 polar amino acid transport system ATP-binding protein [Paraburkholderia tropica]MBB3001643.1 polar amino acid transport system ATP-binding protein [Paraburkholderia tropica]MBB6321161.1 polar amino acid transport system ATP-binding protein [Paraburkholderia tropica]MBN3810773.1 amino acid ABC transporter ATP-binding protein [Paraburkholderia sp. Ac-20347]MDE1144888.1 amino acid ABC transporter ATP-bi